MTDTADDAGQTALAYEYTPGEGPVVVFLPGYASDMTGTKAIALEEWAKANGRAFLRFDYGGCGQSGGDFEQQTLAAWRDDALLMIDEVAEGPVILAGSSMGGWIMLLVARARRERIVGLVGIAAAPDFTDWGFSQAEKMTILQEGRLEKPSPYSERPTVTTRAFWASGEANRVMQGSIDIAVPVRLLHGMRDTDVPWQRSQALMQYLRSEDVHLTLVKDGDHRLSREQDIAALIRAVEEVSERCMQPPPLP
ncbi:alpha/beta fold hydrolase [Sphingomonas canadensis]|uniref:Alpha/beta fold hydrolase n=1 Tax=Sphingomonas canadensis TaxID=1219257 RepID=A0ABW3H3Z3_9SPHN|nr:alpha/beta hydrolase [Sphingomonas canadensis]MCW3835880.1 alpha/beta hydrolase [Sphingomonas canadensis]